MKLSGKNPVFERLRANPSSIKKIYVQKGFSEAGYIHKKCRLKGIPVVPILATKMQKIGRSKNTQGVMADVDDFAYVEYAELLEEALKKKRCLVFIDGLTDPQNLGAIIRSLGCMGKFSIVLPTHDSVSVTEAVLRIASGGENYVQIAQVANLNKAIRAAKESHFTIAGAVVDAQQNLNEVSLTHPVGLVVGSEQKGIRDVIRKSLDIEVSIPMTVATMSMNVSHATTIFCYEFIKQKK